MFIVHLFILLTLVFQHSETKVCTVHIRNILRKIYHGSCNVAENSLKKNNGYLMYCAVEK